MAPATREDLYLLVGQKKQVAARSKQPADFIGADGRNRTGDLLITNQLLYRLSYIGW
jgi:hypothetical protein